MKAVRPMKRFQRQVMKDKVSKKLEEKIGRTFLANKYHGVTGKILLQYCVTCKVEKIWLLSRIFSRRYGIGSEWELRIVDQLDMWEIDGQLAWPVSVEIVFRKQKTLYTKSQINRIKNKLIEIIDVYTDDRRAFMIAIKEHARKQKKIAYDESIKEMIEQVKEKSLAELMTSEDETEKRIGLFIRRHNEEGL